MLPCAPNYNVVLHRRVRQSALTGSSLTVYNFAKNSGLDVNENATAKKEGSTHGETSKH
jgi:hypothetical protein